VKRLKGIPSGSLFLFFPLFLLFSTTVRSRSFGDIYYPPRFRPEPEGPGCFVVGVERLWVSGRKTKGFVLQPTCPALKASWAQSTSTLTQTSSETSCCTPQQMQHYLITASGSARRKRQQHLSTSHSLALVSSSRGCGHATPPLPCRVASLDCSTLRRRNIANIRSEYKYTQEFLRQHPQ